MGKENTIGRQQARDMGAALEADARPCLLYSALRPETYVQCQKIAGIRRYAALRGWRVVTLPRERMHQFTMPLDAAGRAIRPVGCIVECAGSAYRVPRGLSGKLPVAYLDPDGPVQQAGTVSIVCDNAAVVKAAFRELSLANPTAYAAVPFFIERQWSDERVECLRKCCADAGRKCLVFQVKHARGRMPERGDVDSAIRDNVSRLVAWAAGLPLHCAVFAANNTMAELTLRAFREVGRHVPKTATIVGADASFSDDGSQPEISSVHIDFEYAGYAAAKAIGEAESRNGAHKAAPGPSMEPVLFGPMLVDRERSTAGRGRRTAFIVESMNIIRQEACLGITPAKLVKRMGVSKSLFNLRFREATGHSALEEINTCRLQSVLDMLVGTGKPIGAISAFCGFGCDYELRKLFRARFGVSMSQYRKLHH